VQSVTRCVCVCRGGETDTTVGCIEDRVEALKEGIPVDEVETLSSGCPNIRNDQVDVVRRATDSGVESARPELSVSRKLIGHLEIYRLGNQSLSCNKNKCIHLRH
jgi:hypothetical protein